MQAKLFAHRNTSDQSPLFILATNTLPTHNSLPRK